MQVNYCSALVRAGATGARAPAEIWQQVLGTRSEKGATLLRTRTTLLKSPKCSKIGPLNQNNLKNIKYGVNIAKQWYFDSKSPFCEN